MPLRAIVISACLVFLAGAFKLLGQGENPEIKAFESLIKADKFAEAKAALEPFTVGHPSSWQALYQLGYIEFRLHRIQASLTMLSKSLVLHPEFADSHKILAYDLNILGHPDLAVRELEQAIRYDPASAESHYELGRIYYEQGSYLQAVASLEKARSLAPASVRVYHNLGLAYSAVGQNARAVESFDRGLRLNTQHKKQSAWPLIDYATYFNLQGEFGRARDMLLDAIKIENTWDQEFDELSKAYRGLGQTPEAIEALNRAVALNPHKAEYHYVLARLFTQTHQLAEAKAQLAEYERVKSPENK